MGRDVGLRAVHDGGEPGAAEQALHCAVVGLGDAGEARHRLRLQLHRQAQLPAQRGAHGLSQPCVQLRRRVVEQQHVAPVVGKQAAVGESLRAVLQRVLQGVLAQGVLPGLLPGGAAAGADEHQHHSLRLREVEVHPELTNLVRLQTARHRVPQKLLPQKLPPVADLRDGPLEVAVALPADLQLVDGRLHGAAQLLHVDGLEQVGVHVQLQRPPGVLKLLVAGDQNHPRVGPRAPQRLDEVQAVDEGHVDVHQQDVRPQFFRRLQRDLAVLGLRADLAGQAQPVDLRVQAAANLGLVVRNQDLPPFHCPYLLIPPPLRTRPPGTPPDRSGSP